ncbi:MAG: PmoA family protein [Bryobacterales bacterium]|nr:PmoA family protein [Bryobacterales bacterium]
MFSRRGFLQAGAALAGSRARAAAGFRQVHTEGEKVAYFSGERPWFEYRYAAARPKTYVHPLYAPDGRPITLDGPEDHVHHRGLMLAWSDIEGFDFWGETNPGKHGRIEHRRFERVAAGELVEALEWVAEGKVRVLERRTLRPLDLGSGFVALEWISELRPPGAEVVLSAGTHPYNGLGIRFPREMDGGEILNSQGSRTVEKANGEPAAWCAYAGAFGGGRAGVAILDHPGNPRHPAPFFVMNQPFGYISAAPTFREPFRVERAKPLRLRYLAVSFLGPADAAALNALHGKWGRRR